MKQTLEQLEFAISQYADGTLGPLETAALDERLATDADARALLAEYQRLNSVLKASHRVPAVQWEKLSHHISDSLKDQDIPARRLRIFSAQSTSMLAIAASLLIAISMAAAIYLQGETNRQNPGGNTPTLASVVQVSGPSIAVAQASVVQEIAIGPALPPDGVEAQWVQTIVKRPSRVVIASGAASAQDSGPF